MSGLGVVGSWAKTVKYEQRLEKFFGSWFARPSVEPTYSDWIVTSFF